MENRALQPTGSGEQGSGEADNAIVQRRLAMRLFLINPAGALAEYPQLGNDLINFFSESINPHLDDATGLPANGRELDFEQWRAAQEWARQHLNG